MSAHNHSEFVEGCYRCDLSRDEVTGYTPTTDDVAEAWAARYDGEHASASGDERRGYEAEFDRWLAQYTAEVRAAALAEQGETEWEYGLMRDDDYVDLWGVVFDASRELPAMRGIADVTGERIVRRTAPGPWMPMEQENDGA